MPRVHHREIAPTIVLDQQGRFLLQQRDDIPGIIRPGQIGLFGGHREGEETFLECAVRELAEELSFAIPVEQFRFLVSRQGQDLEAFGGTLHAEFFLGKMLRSKRSQLPKGAF